MSKSKEKPFCPNCGQWDHLYRLEVVHIASGSRVSAEGMAWCDNCHFERPLDRYPTGEPEESGYVKGWEDLA